MKQAYHVAFLVLFLNVPSLLYAQITITESFITDNIGFTVTSMEYDFDDSIDLMALVNASGPNQTWDFTGMSFTADSFRTDQTFLTLPADVPAADQFTDSDLVIRLESEPDPDFPDEVTEFYLFHSLQNGSFRSQGSAFLGDADGDGTFEPYVTTFSPASLDLQFPIEYESTWSDSTVSTSTFGGDMDTSSSADLRTFVVDGWGTLIIPQGTYQALRIRTDYSTQSLSSGNIVPEFTDYVFITNVGIAANICVDESIIDAALFILGNPGTSTATEEDVLPSGFRLAQNYPNPFNPTTSIEYTLGSTSEVALTVYTITGQAVQSLVQTTQPAGTYSVSFDASDLASGLYMFRLEAGSFTETRLMSLVK